MVPQVMKPQVMKPQDMMHQVIDQDTGITINILTTISTITMNLEHLIGQVISQATNHRITRRLTHEDHLHPEQGLIDTHKIMVKVLR